MFNFSASITVNRVGRNFHVFGKKMSFVVSASCEHQGADQGEADVELLGWEELREACPFHFHFHPLHFLGVSENSGTPKSSNLIGFSIINHPIWGTPIFGNPHFLHLFFFLLGEFPLTSADQEDETLVAQR